MHAEIQPEHQAPEDHFQPNAVNTTQHIDNIKSMKHIQITILKTVLIVRLLKWSAGYFAQRLLNASTLRYTF
jgi:hypothetical protein